MTRMTERRMELFDELLAYLRDVEPEQHMQNHGLVWKIDGGVLSQPEWNDAIGEWDWTDKECGFCAGTHYAVFADRYVEEGWNDYTEVSEAMLERIDKVYDYNDGASWLADALGAEYTEMCDTFEQLGVSKNYCFGSDIWNMSLHDGTKKVLEAYGYVPEEERSGGSP